MTKRFEPLRQRSRAVFGMARLTYWDDGPISAEVKRLSDGLAGPVAVAAEGGSDEDRATLVEALTRAGAGRITVVDSAPEAVAFLVGAGGVPTTHREVTLGVVMAGEGADAPSADAPVRAVVPVARGADADQLSALRAALESLAADVETGRHVVALWRLRRVIVAVPRRGTDAICDAIDDIELDAPEPRELVAVMQLRSGGGGDLEAADCLAALEVLDAAREGQGDRLVRGGVTVAAEDLARWRTIAADPTLSRSTRDVATTVGRACERILARPGELGRDRPSGAADAG